MRYWMMIFSFTMLIGCQPNLEDVQKAASGGDTKSLLRFLKHENEALHVPSLMGLLAKAPPSAQEAALRDIFTNSEEDELVDAALGASASSPIVRSTFWDTEATPGFDLKRASRHLTVASRASAGQWGQAVTDHLSLIAQRFDKQPDKGAAFVDAILETELPAETRVAVVLKAYDFVKSDFAGAEVNEQTARVFLERIAALNSDLQKTDPKHPMAGCLIVQAAADQIKPLTQASLAGVLDSIVPKWSAGTCSDAGKIISNAAATRFRDVALGEDIGRKILIEPADFCCKFEGEDVCNGYPRESCHGEAERWVQIKPAQYAFAEGEGPEHDADRLVSVANLLLLVRRLGGGSLDTDPLESELRRHAAAESGSVPDQKKVAELEASLKTQMGERKDYLYLGGYIVADHGKNTYEFAFLRAIPSCMGFSCPSPPNVVAGKHALLTTTETSFTTKGRFSIWASQSGTTEITTTDGFNETWNKYSEISKDTVKDLDREISDGQKELSALKAAMAKTGKGMEAERRLIGKAVGDRFGTSAKSQP